VGQNDPEQPISLPELRTGAAASQRGELLVFEPKFIGVYQDFVTIFFWAFTLDLTLDSVTKLAPTVRR
jgi:hypothetical protein